MTFETLHAHRRTILELATHHGARNVRVFGSMVRGDARPNSDIDLLVEIDPGRTLLDLIALERTAATTTMRFSAIGCARTPRSENWKSPCGA